MAILWVALASHCTWESIPGLDFLSCEAVGTPESPGDGHGCDTSCCAVEFAKYQAQRHQEFVPACSARMVLTNGTADSEPSPPAEVGTGVLTSAPPHLLQTWHFSLRAALPVRAPSLAS